MRKKNSRSR